MSEEDPLGADLIGDAHGILDGGVRGVGLVPQTVEKKHVEALQARGGGLGDFAEVGEIGGRAKAEAVDFGVAVNDGDRLEPGAEEMEGTVNGFQFETGETSKLVIRVEDVAEHVADVGNGLG